MSRNIYTVYHDSTICISTKLRHFKKWEGPSYDNGICTTMLYDKQDAERYITMLMDNNINIYQRKTEAFGKCTFIKVGTQ